MPQERSLFNAFALVESYEREGGGRQVVARVQGQTERFAVAPQQRQDAMQNVGLRTR